MDSPAIICEICQSRLDSILGDKGVEYLHPARVGDADHDVVPVEAGPDWRGFCDFCRTGTATWVLPVSDFHVQGQVSAGDWAVCDTCAPLIEKNQWNALVRNIASTYEGDIPVGDVTTTLNGLYRLVRKHTTGGLRRL
ncbi:hypothetical protein [Gordonia malaquae]|uniref:hypothetical protein n=1 Tax=Gordonia malaquae TaxID=410332 RepID=UPI0030183C1E